MPAGVTAGEISFTLTLTGLLNVDNGPLRQELPEDFKEEEMSFINMVGAALGQRWGPGATSVTIASRLLAWQTT